MKNMPTNVLDDLLIEEKNIDNLLENYEYVTFNDYLKILLDKYGYSKNYIIRETRMDERYAKRLFQGKYKISYDFVVAIGIIIGANIHEINKMLMLSENTPLYAQRKRDQIIIHCIKTHKSLIDTNLFLQEKGLHSLLKKTVSR